MSNKPKKPSVKSSGISGPKVFDISKPGGSAPTSSARPLIVTHRPMVQDPMVAPPADPLVDLNGSPASDAPKTVLKPQKIKLQPSPEAIQELAEQVAGTKKDEIQTETDEVSSATESKAITPTDDGSGAPKKETLATEANFAQAPAATLAEKPSDPLLNSSEPSQKPTPDTEGSSDDKTPAKAKPNPVTEQAAAKKEAEAETERQEQYEKVIESHKYFVHISSPEKKRSMRLAVIGAILIILVAAGCVDAMLDAGVMDVPGLPHTHFIK